MDDLWAPAARALAQQPEPESTLHQLAAADVRVTLSDGRSVGVNECRSSSWEGGGVWPPALLLAEYLDLRLIPGLGDLSACNVLELGAGCGLVGLVAARLGAKVCFLTDLEVALATLAGNVSMNGWHDDAVVSVAALDWNAPVLPSCAFGLIIASECIYDEDMAEPLLRTMHSACSDGTVCLVAGIIGGAALDAFRRYSAELFERREVLPHLRAGDDSPPASRAVHMLSCPRGSSTRKEPHERPEPAAAR